MTLYIVLRYNIGSFLRGPGAVKSCTGVLFIGVAAKEPIHINYSIYLGVCQGMFHVKHLDTYLVRWFMLSESCSCFVRFSLFMFILYFILLFICFYLCSFMFLLFRFAVWPHTYCFFFCWLLDYSTGNL